MLFARHRAAGETGSVTSTQVRWAAFIAVLASGLYLAALGVLQGLPALVVLGLAGLVAGWRLWSYDRKHTAGGE
jgi:flagellar biosynthesis component FlhA